ncbi:hypothetical protein IC229_24835 [Spirosoma sp. BT702]|uniref:Uncharacterized protein n=1 Tax=Spirosoma profusum TaxID=2771354 RepID=A0A926Y4X7_9BACT|nr:hypothetical protein [Spirosoma profusum]MBD2703895.1 hypothetical protein [Spirosoma profusum]
MSIQSSFWSNPPLRRWTLQLLGLLLAAGLLCMSIWLFYGYKIRQLEQQQNELIKPNQ